MVIRISCAVAVIAAAAFAGVACSSGGDNTVQLTTLPAISSDGDMDGRIRYHVNTGTTFLVAPNLPIIVGDADCLFPQSANNGYGYRGFLCFPLSSIPAGANVTEVILQVPQTAVTSGASQENPYPDLGNLTVHHITLTNGTSLSEADCLKSPIANMGTLSTGAALGVKSLNVTSAVRTDLDNGRTYSHFRVQFSITDSDRDTTCENVTLNDGEEHAGASWDPPQILVTYQP